MQAKQFAELRRQWEAKGNPPCDHPQTDKEYILGGDTGDRGCIVCGEVPVERRRRQD